MAKILLLEKGRSLRFILTLMSCFFLVTTGWGQTDTTVVTNPYAYSQAGLANPTVTSDKDDYAPGETAIITGTGWTEDTMVDIHLEEEPAHDHHHGYHGTPVDSLGNWTIKYPIEERHLGVKFTVIVDGVQSKFQGLAYFTDGKINFHTQGLPAGTSVNVTYSYDGQGNNNGSGNILIIAPGPTIYTVNNANFSYSFPNTVIGTDGAQYTLTSSPSGSISDTGGGNKEYTITGNYVLACTAPSSLSYSTNSASYCTGTAITANSPTSSGGAVTSYWISSPLPTGLSFNITTGVISGTPTATSAATNYTITANNVCGSTTATLNIAVGSAPSSLSYTTPVRYCVGTPIPTNSPTVTGNVTTYSVSPELPSGLSINSSTGVISGTPTTASAATNYTVTATNSCGSITANVNITVDSAPTFTACSTDITTNTSAGTCSATVTYTTTASTNATSITYSFSGDTTGSGSGDGSGSTFNIGTTTVTVTATNDCGSAICSFDVTVEDNIAPSLTAVENQTEELNASCEFAIPDYTGLTTGADNCGTATVTQLPIEGTVISGDGTVQTVTLTADDGNGNTSSITFDVTLEDNIDPTLTAVDDRTEELNASCEFAIPDYTGLTTGADNCGTATVTQLPIEGTVISGDGTVQTVTLTADDGNGNTSSITFDVTLEDNIDPTLTAVDDRTEELNASCEFAIPDYTGLTTGADNCGTATVTQLPIEGTVISGDGTVQTVTLTADDGNGNTSSITFDVTLEDNIDPTLTAVDDRTEELNASCEFAIPDYTGLTTGADNCGTATVTQLPIEGTVISGDGTVQTVTLTADDGNGNTSSITFDVTLEDNIDPTLTAVDDRTEELNASCEFAIPDYTGLTTGADNCGTATVTQLPIEGTVISGDGTVQTVTLTADDGNGNTSSITFDVTLEDNIDPTLTAVDDRTEELNASCEFAIPDYTGLTTGADNCGTATVTQLPIEGTVISGDGTVQTVTLTADDGNGNTSSITFDVTLEDNIDPTLTAVDDRTEELNASCEFAIPDYTGLTTGADNCGTATVTQLPIEGTVISGDGTVQTVTLTADDGNGNTSSITFDVTLEDNIDPTLTAVDDRTEELNASCEFAIPDYTGLTTGADNCGTATVTQLPIEGTVISGDGTVQTVTLTADDGNGNTSSITFDVTLEDNIDPTLACPANAERSNDPGTCTYTAVGNEFDPTYSDNCGVVSITNDHNNSATLSGAVFQEGETIVEWTVTDAAGNPSTCTFTVNVTNEAPLINSITGPIDPVQVNTGGVKLTASYEDNNVVSAKWSLIANEGVVTEYTCTDCIGEGTIEGNFNPQPGVYTVELEVTDACGATALLKYEYIVIFDPTGGFVTGGGWIESPVGAMEGDKYGVTGRANFGFNAKYKTGKNNLTEVDGHTNFQFKAGDLHFSSFEHEDMSLVIAGKKATYTGYGTVNGSGVHRFRVIAIDGQANGGIGPDQFRIKIWGDGSNSDADVLYDNHRGVAESSDLATTLGGGSIVIHKPKTSGTKMAETTVKLGSQTVVQEPVTLNILGNLVVAPNPVRSEAAVRFSLIEDANVTLTIFDFNGREVNKLFSGAVKAEEVKEVSFQRNNMMSGVYIVKLMTDRGHSYDKQIIVE